MSAKTVSIIFAALIAIAVIAETVSATAGGNEFTKHCPALCTEVKGHARKHETCMNNCMCAAYCVIFDAIADLPLDVCTTNCLKLNPYSTGDDFFSKMESFLRRRK